MGFRFVGRLFTRQHDWRQFCFRFSAIPKLGAPAQQSTRGKSGRATAETLFPGYSHSSTMASFSSLVKLRRWVRPSRAESAAVASVKSRSTTDSLAALRRMVIISLAVTFATLAPEQRADGTGLFNLSRNVGSSVGISVVSYLLIMSVFGGKTRRHLLVLSFSQFDPRQTCPRLSNRSNEIRI